MAHISADQLYRFIVANAEMIDGQLVCRASLMEELRRRGVQDRQQTRIRLVKELTQRGLVSRPNPRSRWLIVHQKPGVTSTPLRTFSCDKRRTTRRIKKLRGYCDAHVLSGGDFVCSSWSACEGSIGPGCSFTEGQLSYVGHHYDLADRSRELRVVVVGQEVGGGGKPRISLERRHLRIHQGRGLNNRFHAQPGFKGRNPHMRGTTLALRAIFGLRGKEHEAEFVYIGNEHVHVFDCFALVNRAYQVAGSAS